MTNAEARVLFLVPLTALLIAACGGGDGAGSATPDAPAPGANTAAAAPTNVPDACTFFSRAELEESVGWELREGDKEDAPPGFSECDFETPTRMSVTRTFPNPPLPEAVGFSSVTVNTHPSDPVKFAEFRRNLGAGAEDVPGVGDGAYFYGRDMLYVRVGNRGFSIRIYSNAGNDADWARVRDVMLKLGRLGASRLTLA